MMSTKKSNHISFAAKVWATSAIGTPFIAAIILSFFESDPDYLGMLTLLSIGVGLGLSFPCFILLAIGSYYINTSELEDPQKKGFITIIAIILNIILFQIVFWGFFGENNDSIWITLAYSLSLTIGTWIYPLKFTPNKMELPSELNRNRKYLEDILDDEKY